MSLETRLSATESKTSDLETENAVQAADLMSLETRLTASESKTSDLETEIAELQTRLSSSESELLISKSKIETLERENAERKVAFYTALTDARDVGPFDSSTTLKYSFFTAPVRGVYYFQFTACGYQAGYMGVQVYKNNQMIMFNDELNDGSYLKYLTNSVVLELMAGDEIHLVLPSGYHLFDNHNNISTFSGSLLFTL
ncbi:complement C1q-like protein 3 [Centropristis striata]|uniref:complement C1q-like protein 3 n=1 Tax=Centropristis striata TaxID=184440 RepID=UPI0027E109C1|nr:complement C1q-like protein 3 [Centropristis striata]